MNHPAHIREYVFTHFCSIYSGPNVTSEDLVAKCRSITIPSPGASFFLNRNPYPEKVIYKSWNGQLLPFFFAEHDSDEIISEENGRVQINYDIISSAFYLLSGWQEYYSEERDQFGRFPYAESIQYKHHFITIPVVNYYFDILKTTLEKAYGISMKTARWNGKAFTTFVSHDLDRLKSGWKIEGLSQLKKGNLLNVAKLLQAKATGKDHWNNLETVVKTVKKYGAVSTVFWLANHKRSGQLPNADYAIEEPEYQELIKYLEKQGFETGMHGSFGTSENARQLNSEKEKINPNLKGNRFHYLCYDPKNTPTVLEESGIAYDCTMGFAEHFGFRNSYCFPFYPFNFKTNRVCSFLEIPLNLMDTTLWHPNYLQLPQQEILPAITPMLQEIDKFGGVFGLLWHNENFSKLNNRNGLAVFKEIMQHLKNQNSAFLTGSEILKAYTEKQ